MKNFNSMDCAAVAIRRTTPSGKAAGAALLTIALTAGISGCSHAKKDTARSNQNSSTQTQTSQVVAPTVPTAVNPLSDTPKKKSVKGPVKRLPATRTYKDESAGLSFTYPRRSTLEVGDKADQDVVVATELPMNFVREGGTTLAVVEMPGMSKSGSDFTPAFFTISRNKQLTTEECERFAESANAEKANSDSADKAASVPPKLTIDGIEYVELDKQTEKGSAKYYHRFVSGTTPDENACYEFGMSVKSLEAKQDAQKASDSDREHKDAFARLEKILASVTIKSEKKNEVVEAKKSASTDSPAAKSEPERLQPEASNVETAKTAARVDASPR